MQELKKYTKEWENLIDAYEKDAKTIQRKITAILKSEWSSNARAISVRDMKKFIIKSGNLKWYINRVNLELNFRKIFNKSRIKITSCRFRS